jgi:hypothetical protein
MPDDYHPPLPRRNPEDVDLGAIKADLEFLIERVARLPTRKELALRPLPIIAHHRRERGARSGKATIQGPNCAPLSQVFRQR